MASCRWSAKRLFSAAAMLLTVALLPGPAVVGQSPRSPAGEVLFNEDFESGLGRWSFPFGSGHGLVQTGDEHETALAMETVGAPVYALVTGSETWGDVRIEGDVLFRDDDHNYLGFIYRYRDDGRRIDFGSLYIKGNGGYVQANEHADTNVGRTVQPEIRATLEGSRTVNIGAWQRFALEVRGAVAHLYVGDMEQPVVTMPPAATREGGFGFKPRNPGAGVWIDNLVVRPIRRLTYDGPPRPDPAYRPNDWLTDWEVLGPLGGHSLAVETVADGTPDHVVDGERRVRWRAAPADHRGAVLTGRVVEFRGNRHVAYYRTTVHSDAARTALLRTSTADDLAIWVNGTFVGFAARQGFAWWDALHNDDHAPVRASLPLRSGSNEIVVRVVGGVYATGGFYLAVDDVR